MDLCQDRQLHQTVFRQITDHDLLCILEDNLLDGNNDIHRTIFILQAIEGHGALKMVQAQEVLRHQGNGDLMEREAQTFLDMVLSQWGQSEDHGARVECLDNPVCGHLTGQT